jgi:GNAT superfamily N-acetyltransferase
MIQVREIESIEQLSELKQQYIDQTTAPLDGMWLCGFVPIANHFGFYKDEKLVGFCCINDDGYLLQFHLSSQIRDQASLLFDSVLIQKSSPIEETNGAFVSTAEPQYLSLCLDNFSKFTVHSLMYQLNENSKSTQRQESILKLIVVKSEQLNEIVDFARINTGAPEEWLTGYYNNLINRKELFGFWQNGRLLAAGESRGYDAYQTDYADLGVIVDESSRGNGLATMVLKQLIAITEGKGLKPILSTEKSNIGAQKAISRAGFFAGNRIIQFDLSL